ncbi:MAG: tRNA-guanine transglycosylase, partial [Candidatus Omnitrophica bacterium]|nr:tRNA-guanine transglycosylase [Candidatus Omnitrophota bacterium]
QGATYPNLRRRSIDQVRGIQPQGYAIGGLSVGEPRELMLEVLEATTAHLPEDAARYLMGVGEPLDLVDGVLLGVDLFDCVVPTRHGRNGAAYTWGGRLNLRNAVHVMDQQPLDKQCPCYACRHHSRSYLHHLLKTQEILGLHLLSLHNLHFYADLMRQVRMAIEEGNLLSLRRTLASTYSDTNPEEILS